ncbi:hypothetical protein BC937DRAFT_95121 [Endogone sp. FLAS-F59071]|nr:hypothetical protein BC937DRAFT_95121 [Endogone sp. FLAS-F59071]|eukprot:RUS22908.1 hypothetical protein BC937DRAFT_95121 [Endogone sp. FLAS-F59071]
MAVVIHDATIEMQLNLLASEHWIPAVAKSLCQPLWPEMALRRVHQTVQLSTASMPSDVLSAVLGCILHGCVSSLAV